MQKSWVMEIAFAYLGKDVPMAGARRRGDAWIHASLPVRFPAADPEAFVPAMTATDPHGGRVDYRTDGRFLYAPIGHPVLNERAFQGGYAGPPTGQEQAASAIEDGVIRLATGLDSAAAAATKANKAGKSWEAREGVSDPAARTEAEERLRGSVARFVVFDDMLWGAIASPQWLLGTDPDNDQAMAPFLHLPSEGGNAGAMEARFLPYRHEEAGFDDLESALIKAELVYGHRPRHYGELEIHPGVPGPTPAQLEGLVAIREAMLVGRMNRILKEGAVSRDVFKLDREGLMRWADLKDAVGAINGRTDVEFTDRFWIPRDAEDDRTVAMKAIAAENPELVQDLIRSLDAFARPLLATEERWSDVRRDLTDALSLAGMAMGSRAYADRVMLRPEGPTR